MSALSARQTILLVVLFVVTSLGFIALDNRQALDPLKTGVHDLIVPVTDQLTSIGEDSPGDQTELQQQYDALQAERPDRVPSAEEIAAEFERFLAEREKDD